MQDIITPQYCALGTKDCDCHVVRLSHNLIDNAVKFKKAALNLLITIVYMLRKYVTTQPMNDFDFREVRLSIPIKNIQARHVAELSPSLMYLMSLALVFHRQIPGYSSNGITRLVSGIRYENASAIVTIPGDAIPWLIYCGKQVGFALVEANVIIKLQSRTDKLLYLLLLSKLDNSSTFTSFEISLEELYQAMDLKATRPFSSVWSKNLKKFPDVLRKKGSQYTVKIVPIKAKRYIGSKGRKPIESVRFDIHKDGGMPDQKKTYLEVAYMLINLMNKCGIKNIGVVKLVQEIEAGGNEDDFVYKMRRISDKNIRERNDRRLINTAAKILRDDFKIEINAD